MEKMPSKFEIVIPVECLERDTLTGVAAELVATAVEATERAYAPYSNFHVGAAIRLDNGETVSGSNQENVAFPSGTCAERTTCYYAHSRYPEAKFEAIAVAARNAGGELVDEPVAPCGACRQALLQYEMLAGHNVEVYLVGATQVYKLPSVRSLLPFAFTEF